MFLNNRWTQVDVVVLQLIGTKPLPWPMLTRFTKAWKRHLASTSSKEGITSAFARYKWYIANWLVMTLLQCRRSRGWPRNESCELSGLCSSFMSEQIAGDVATVNWSQITLLVTLDRLSPRRASGSHMDLMSVSWTINTPGQETLYC